MARTSTRGWKGCAMCKSYKDRSFGDPVRFGRHQQQQAAGGTPVRYTRRSIPADQFERELLPSPFADPSDCQHGCNGYCLISGSETCNFTCHPDLRPADLALLAIA